MVANRRSAPSRFESGVAYTLDEEFAALFITLAARSSVHHMPGDTTRGEPSWSAYEPRQLDRLPEVF